MLHERRKTELYRSGVGRSGRRLLSAAQLQRGDQLLSLERLGGGRPPGDVRRIYIIICTCMRIIIYIFYLYIYDAPVCVCVCVNTYKLYYVYIRECECGLVRCGSFGRVRREEGFRGGVLGWKPGQVRSRSRLIGRRNLFDRGPISRRNTSGSVEVI